MGIQTGGWGEGGSVVECLLSVLGGAGFYSPAQQK